MWGMIDLETIDTRDSAVILSIGMFAFDKNTAIELAENADEFLAKNREQLLLLNMEVQRQLDNGRTIGWETIQWWMEQSSEAKEVFLSKDIVRYTAEMAALEIRNFIKDNNIDKVWAYPSTFDHAILNEYWLDFGEMNPIHYTNQLDMRTPRYLTQVPRPKRIEWMINHNAMWDCVDQAIWLQKMFVDGKLI